jgi:hypothetical protein
LPSETEIVIIDSLDEQVHKNSPEFAPELQARATCIKADLRDIESYREAAEGTDCVSILLTYTPSKFSGSHKLIYLQYWDTPLSTHYKVDSQLFFIQ